MDMLNMASGCCTKMKGRNVLEMSAPGARDNANKKAVFMMTDV
jgi:hypothetical protein